MLNQLLRLTLVSSVLLWLRPRWRGLLLLSVFVLLVHVLHGEFLGYVELSGNDAWLVHSFVLKWVSLIVALLVYYVFAVSGLKGTQLSPRKQETAVREVTSTKPGEDDGFDFLRHKGSLQSRAEKLLSRPDRKGEANK